MNIQLERIANIINSRVHINGYLYLFKDEKWSNINDFKKKNVWGDTKLKWKFTYKYVH